MAEPLSEEQVRAIAREEAEKVLQEFKDDFRKRAFPAIEKLERALHVQSPPVVIQRRSIWPWPFN